MCVGGGGGIDWATLCPRGVTSVCKRSNSEEEEGGETTVREQLGLCCL